jgi:hypothetical protein
MVQSLKSAAVNCGALADPGTRGQRKFPGILNESMVPRNR